MIITPEILAAFMLFLGTLVGSGENYSTDINDYEVNQTEVTSDTSSERRPVGRITFKAKEGAT